MRLDRRGSWAGLGFGLAVAIAASAFMLSAMFARVEPAPLLLAQFVEWVEEQRAKAA